MASNKSVMVHQFSQVPKAEIQRSTFDRSHGYKTTFDASYLVPVFVDEVLPGDTFNLKMTAFARMATPIFPIMDNLFLESFFFFVPNRLVWDNWQRFNGEQTNPDDSTDFVIPEASRAAAPPENSLEDYFGLPVGNMPSVRVNAMPFRAYNLIWNEWFRDQNLQDSLPVPRGDGPDTIDINFNLMRRNKRHDYFTSALPWTQKGPSVDVPLGGSAPIRGLGTQQQVFAPVPEVTVYESDLTSRTYDFYLESTVANALTIEGTASNGYPAVFADLNLAEGPTINALRQSFQIQRMLERDARGGTRYTEIIEAHFGVTSPDARLQRPEYLGGGSTMVNISPIAQTSGTAAPDGYTPTPQGNLAAIGTAEVRNHGFVKSFTEHGHIIGLVNVRADLTYQQGLNRLWFRETRYDFYWPALAHLGEQVLYNIEIFYSTIPNNQLAFGYQERYAEYRYKPSLITGRFRSTSAVPLDAWHLSQEFGALPGLNEAFIQEDVPMDRVIAVQDEPHFLFDAYFDLKCARPMPLYGVPGLIDHF